MLRLLLLLYLFLILWGLNIAKESKDRFGAILAVGIVAIGVLAGGHQCGDGDRSSSGCGDSAFAFQLWGVIPDHNHGGHGSFDEYQYEAFYVSISSASFLFVA